MTQVLSALDRRMLEFNQLPSLTLHPARHAEFGMPFPFPPGLPGAPDMEQRRHRHWSRAILLRLGLLDRPVLDVTQPELAVALLAPERLVACASLMGAVLCAPRLRRAISGADVRMLLDTLGQDALDIARRMATRLHPGLADSQRWSIAEVANAVPRLGAGALHAALRRAAPEIRLRAELRLPPEAPEETPLDPDEALDLSLNLLRIIDPTWHSSFPAIR